jgi:transposase
MARYKDRSRTQGMMMPIHLEDQLVPGTFEYTVDYLVDNEIDLSVFESRYANDEVGAPAYDPAVLLKVVVCGYARGMTSSRGIARACEENIIFMALSADSRPHFTTIAEFVSSMSEQIESVFTDVLTVCYTEGLIGKKMFAIDGCKISSNCSKEWSGTKAELRKKAEKLERSVSMLLDTHRKRDASESEPGQKEREEKAILNLKAKAAKVREFLATNEERIGTQGKPVKSNVTDKESAKMPSSHGVIQGYNGIATVDDEHQVIVDAQAFGDGHEAKHVGEVIDSVDKRMRKLDAGLNIYKEAVITADTSFHSEASVRTMLDRGIDAYIADTHFRRRDPRFAEQQMYKAKTTDKRRTSKKRMYFTASEFTQKPDGSLYCPAGKKMNWRTKRYADQNRGYEGRSYRADPKDCAVCELRSRCIRGKKATARTVNIIDRATTAIERMIERFDTERGRHYYSRRMGTVEPVFANIRHNHGLDWFSLRGRVKVDTQWKLFCMVHNIGKIAGKRRAT